VRKNPEPEKFPVPMIHEKKYSCNRLQKINKILPGKIPVKKISPAGTCNGPTVL
jgi:hypothetical protein